MRVKPFNKHLPFIAPKRATEWAAGYDLSYAGEPVIIQPMQRVAMSTNIVLEIPDTFYGRIAPRSGLAFKSGIDVLAGVIDCDYRGEIKVILINLGDKAVGFNTGDKIAQIIFESFFNFPIDVVEELGETTRGENGFGSTGS